MRDVIIELILVMEENIKLIKEEYGKGEAVANSSIIDNAGKKIEESAASIRIKMLIPKRTRDGD